MEMTTMQSNNNDDDSHTTLGDDKPNDLNGDGFESSSLDLLASPLENPTNAAQQDSPDASSSSQSVISPSTQTLNVLSQHDAAGGGDLRYNMANMEQDASAVTASQQLAASISESEPQGFQGWNVSIISLYEPGPLGMTVRKLTTSDGRGFTIIKRVKAGSQADKAGIQAGDLVGVRYEDFCAFANKPRPIRFPLLRKPQEEDTPIATNRRQGEVAATSGTQIKVVQQQRQQGATTSSTNATSTTNTTPPIVSKSTATTKHATNAPNKSTTTTNAAMSPEEEQAAVILASQLASTILSSTASTGTIVPTTGTTAHPPTIPSKPVQDSVAFKPTTAPPSTGIATKSKLSPPRPKDTSVIVAAARRITANRRTDKPPPPPQQQDDDDIVPFCKACQKPGSSSNRPHHALCPKHSEFDNSGALEKLQLVKQGMQLNCPACISFYQHGRVVNSKLAHCPNCPRATNKLRQNGQVVNIKDSNTTTTTTTTQKKKQAPTKKRGNASTATTKKKDSTNKNKKKPTTKKASKTKAKTTEPKSTTVPAQDDQSFSQVLQDGYADAGLIEAPTQEETTTSRRAKKKSRYDYDSDDSDDHDEQLVKENTRPISKRAKFVQQGSNVPLVVEASKSKKKQKVKKPLRTQAPVKPVDDRPIKPTWVPCANPWGPSGYQEGDVVLVTPSGGFTHHETVYGGPRFTVSPFGSEFDYGNTHRAPSEGFDVILLTRDPNAEHPWGFTYRRHEFGGACLVASVDPLSPAASAVYRGNESAEISGACLRVHDMILSMNGKSIGGMTELGVSIELEVCGRELELVVARYRDAVGAGRQIAMLERNEWRSFDEAMNDKSRLDWFEMDCAGTSPSIKMVEESGALAPFGGTSSDPLGFDAMSPPLPKQFGRSTLVAPHNNLETHSHVSGQFSLSQLSLSSPAGSLVSRRSVHLQTPRGNGNGSTVRSVATSRREEDDDQAWLGCVCGEIHPEPIRVFWIQCDECQNWHNVAPVCVGFNELQASSVGSWVCRVCSDSVTEDQSNAGRSAPPVYPRGSFGKRLSKVPGPSSSGRNNPFSTPASKASSLGSKVPTAVASRASKRKSPVPTNGEVVEDRKKRRTEDGCFLPLKSPRQLEDGTYARPCGRTPPGMAWDAVAGKYTPKSKLSSKKKSTPSSAINVPTNVVVVPPQPRPPPKTRARGPPIESPITPRSSVSADPSARRTEDGCFLPLRSPRMKEDGTYARPCGRAPPGMTWDAIAGKYVPVGGSKTKGTPSNESTRGVPANIVVPRRPPAPKKKASESPVETPANAKRKATVPSTDPKQRRTEDGCFLPLTSPRKKEDGTYARPCGRAPPGMTWNAVRGVYVPIQESRGEEEETSPPTKKVCDSTPKSKDSQTANESPSGGKPDSTATKSADKTSSETPRSQPAAVVAAKPVESSSPAAAPSEDTPVSEPTKSPPAAEPSEKTPVEEIKKPTPPKKGSREERDAERASRKLQDGCFRPKSAPQKLPSGDYARPRGRCPPGYFWDSRRGVFAPVRRKPKKATPAPKEPSTSNVVDASTPKESNQPSATTKSPPSIGLPNRPIKLVVTGSGIETTSGVVSPDEIKLLPVGTLVKVAARVWIGSNKEGGIGTIIDYHEGDETIVYDVKYSLGGRETGIDSRWVSPHDFSGRGSVMRQK